MNTTTFDHFTVETDELLYAPEGRDWGTHHWQFTVTARESGAVYVGVYSVGSLAARRFRSGAASLPESIIQSLGTEAPTALEGEGDLRKTLEALELEGMGYGLVEGYDVAVNLVNLHNFVEALTDDERDALTNDEED